jgi:hypothetical protein
MVVVPRKCLRGPLLWQLPNIFHAYIASFISRARTSPFPAIHGQGRQCVLRDRSPVGHYHGLALRFLPSLGPHADSCAQVRDGERADGRGDCARGSLGSTTANPQLGSGCIDDFLAANSTGTNRSAEETGLRHLFQSRFFRWRSSVLKLKPRLWQNSLRRIPLLTKSATKC